MTEDERDRVLDLEKRIRELGDQRTGIIFGALLVIFIIICMLTNTTGPWSV